MNYDIDVAVEQQPEVRLEGWTDLHISSDPLLNNVGTRIS